MGKTIVVKKLRKVAKKVADKITGRKKPKIKKKTTKKKTTKKKTTETKVTTGFNKPNLKQGAGIAAGAGAGVVAVGAAGGSKPIKPKNLK